MQRIMKREHEPHILIDGRLENVDQDIAYVLFLESVVLRHQMDIRDLLKRIHKVKERLELLLDPVIVEEKVDGSQFSFGRFDSELRIRSKGKEMIVDAPEKMFQLAVNLASSLDLRDGWTYRGEFLSKPKHNALAYDRVPNGNVILFDINTGEEGYLNYEDKQSEANRIGVEIVPLLFTGEIKSANDILCFLERTSILGGQKIEGVVIKNYNRFGRDKKVLMGKYVSEAYKEVHNKEWGSANPKQGDIVQRLIDMYRIDTRWEKSVIHLKEKYCEIAAKRLAQSVMELNI